MSGTSLIDLPNGVRIAASCTGQRGSGRPTVLLNGGMGMPESTWQFTGLPESLAERGFPVIAYSARGVRPSEAPAPPYTVPDLAGDARLLLDHFGVGEVILVGYSMGCYVTQALAPRRGVRGVAMIAGLRSSAIGELVNEMELDLLERYGDVPGDVSTFETLVTTLGTAELQDAATVRAWRSMLTDGESSWTSTDGRHGQVAASQAWMTAHEPTEERLRAIDVPALVVAYQHDLFFPPATTRAAAALLPDAEFVEVAGHAHGGLMLDAQRTATTRVVEFCEHLVAPAAQLP